MTKRIETRRKSVATAALALLSTLAFASCGTGPEPAPAPEKGTAAAPSAPGRPNPPLTSPAHAPAAGRAAVGASLGNVAPDFALKDAEGRTVKLSDYKGKVVVLDFWATWCPPCRQEIPGFVALHSKYKGQGVEVIGVTFDESWAPVKPFVESYGVNYTVVMGDQGVASRFGNISGIPTTFVIDRDGIIRKKHVGYGPPELFTQAVESVL
jgi:peroxiredoxin